MQPGRRSGGDIVTRSADELMAAFGTPWAETVDARHGMILARAQAYENTARWQRSRSLGRAMGRDSVRLTAQRPEHLGFFTLESLTLEHPRFDGGPPMEVTRAVFRAGEAVTLLPYDPVRDRVLLVEQFRAAPYAQGDPEPWLLEPIAGIVDGGRNRRGQRSSRGAGKRPGFTVESLQFISRLLPLARGHGPGSPYLCGDRGFAGWSGQYGRTERRGRRHRDPSGVVCAGDGHAGERRDCRGARW